MDKENDLFIKYPGYKKLHECFIELAGTDIQKDAIEQIMKNGEYNGFKLNSMLSNKKYNDNTELNRRIDFAEMILFDENLFFNLANNGLNVFHGTKIDALETILNKGLFSSSELSEKGIQLRTGEEYDIKKNSMHDVGKRAFISLTDDFSTSAGYAGFPYEEQTEFFTKNYGESLKSDEDIPIILCFNGTDIKQEYGKSLVDVKSTCNEIGITASINSSDIKCIITSYDKMEYVKSLASKHGIDVLGYDLNNKLQKRFIDKKGKFYSISNNDIAVDEQEFENSKDIIKETLKQSNNRNNMNELSNHSSISNIPIEEDSTMAIPSDIKMDTVFDLAEQYNNGGPFTPATANDLIAKYNINESVAQQLALEINTMIEGYIQGKEEQKENSTPYFLDGFEETQEISTQMLGKQTVDIQKDVKRMDSVEQQLNEHMQEQTRSQGKIENKSSQVEKDDDDYVM